MNTSATLLDCGLDDLERIYRDAPTGPIPTVNFRGRVLCRVGTRFAQRPVVTALLLPFERMTFGVDFANRAWWFRSPRIRVGRFRVDAGVSRWRDTETLRLRYDVSRLPFRAMLYDEVKPLNDALCLGLGGINLEVGRGDLFFFVLEAMGARRPIGH